MQLAMGCPLCFCPLLRWFFVAIFLGKYINPAPLKIWSWPLSIRRIHMPRILRLVSVCLMFKLQWWYQKSCRLEMLLVQADCCKIGNIGKLRERHTLSRTRSPITTRIKFVVFRRWGQDLSISLHFCYLPCCNVTCCSFTLPSDGVDKHLNMKD